MPCEEHIDVEQLALGNHDAFRELFMKYYPKVKYFITRFVKSEAIAEELSQDIFEHIWINRKNLSEIQSLNAYMFRMAKNKALNYLSHKEIEETYASSCTNLPEYSLEEEIDASDLEQLILLAVEKMPKQRRRIFEMSRMENLKNAEIAEKLGIAKKTVEVHLNLALKEIRKVIA
ncbi:DNA-directed RNA polymerase sigma-70 factor [Bacteroidia bacterium]|nr:DNA-directed RNA polymerase sigma-70 factor [Bacteroidia bacterium]